MFNWILKFAIKRLDKDINEYRKQRKLEIIYLNALPVFNSDFDYEKQEHRENIEALRGNIEWCIKWRNRMARRVGIQTLMAW